MTEQEKKEKLEKVLEKWSKEWQKAFARGEKAMQRDRTRYRAQA